MNAQANILFYIENLLATNAGMQKFETVIWNIAIFFYFSVFASTDPYYVHSFAYISHVNLGEETFIIR